MDRTVLRAVRPTILAATLLTAAACSGGAAEQPELTRAQKDSIIADMPVPGASGVGRAMQARDRANARAADHDSIGNDRP